MRRCGERELHDSFLKRFENDIVLVQVFPHVV